MKVLIIGGGVSGLSAGIYLLLAGHEVTVAEQHGTAGGNLTGWRRAGCTVDNCIHWLCGTDPRSKNHAMWETLGVLGGVPVHYGESLYTVRLDGRTLSLYSDTDRTERALLAASPEDEKEIRRLMRAVRTVQSFGGTGANGLTAAEKAAGAQSLISYYRLTAGELASRFRSPLIRKFISSFLTERFGALGLIFVFADFCSKNAGIPAGGSIAAANRMAERFEKLGGQLLLNKKAVNAERKGKRLTAVSFEDGSRLGADAFVFAQDPASVFGGILDMPMPKKLAALYENSRLMRFSSLHCAFLTDAEKLPFTGDLIADLPPDAAQRYGAKHIALREYSYLENSAPAGQSLLCGMIFCDERTARRFIALYNNNEEAYKAEKQALAAAMTEAAEGEMPELSGKLRLIDSWTPATYRRFTGSRIGSYMSFAFSSRVLPRSVKCRTGLKNAVLATQWLRPPGGLPVAAGEGKKAAEELIKRSAALEKTRQGAERALLRARLLLRKKRSHSAGTAV